MSEHISTAPIATISFVNDKTGDVAEDLYGIWPKEERSLGCKDVQQLVNDHDPTISRHHVTIRCVQFDEDAAKWNVAPMIYALDRSANGTILKRECLDEDGNPMLCEYRLTKSMGPILLADGDRLYFSNTTFMELREVNPTNEDKMDFVMSCETQRFMDTFTVAPRLIGAGGQGKIYIAWDQETALQVACKAVPLRGVELDRNRVGEDASELGSIIANSSPTPNTFGKMSQGGPKKLLEKIHGLEVEYDILKDLDHPNIINMRKVFITSHYIYIIQELMTGGDLFSFIEAKGKSLDNALTAVITRQVLKAVEYLHERGIVHRDIKPDNILMTSWKDSARIVLTDFGLAKRISPTKKEASKLGAQYRMFSMCGTGGFVAPEVYQINPTIAAKQGYSKAVDMWSIGSVTGLMLTGSITFDYRGAMDETGEQIPPHDLSIIDRGEKGWDTVPRRAREFVKALLQLDERKRLSAKQALEHSWFTNHTCASTFDAVYAHSIRDWKPRITSSTSDIVMQIDTSDIMAPSPIITQPVRCSSPPATIYKSQFFRSTPSPVNPQSNALSDEMDVSHNDPANASQDTPDVPDFSEIPERSTSNQPLQQPSLELPWPSPPHRPRKQLSSSSLPLPNQGPSSKQIAVNPDVSLPDDDEDDLDNLKPSPDFPWPHVSSGDKNSENGLRASSLGNSPSPHHRNMYPSYKFPWPSIPRINT